MGDTLIRNIGRVLTGDLEAPVADVESVHVENGRIAEMGATATDADTVIDAAGLTLTPGLIDSHVHPVFGDYTPRQRTVGWTESYLHGGVTSMVSNGEPHLPGRPDDVESAKALATLAHKSSRTERPGGVKVRGGTLILSGEMTEADIEDVHQAGVERLKFLLPVEDTERARDLVRWGDERDMVTMMHCGGTSLPGVKSTDASMFMAVRPDIAAHVNGGPTPISDAEVETLVAETDIVLDLVLAGNQRVAVDVLRLAADRDELDRVQIGTDTPSGTGVVPLGVIAELAVLGGMTDVAGERLVCLATGTTAAHHGLDTGTVSTGAPADLALLGPAKGSHAGSAVDAIERGEYAAVDTVLVDGEVMVDGSRNSPPATASATVTP